MGAAVLPVWVAVLVAPPLVEVQVAVWPVIVAPLLAPNVKVTTSDPVAAVVDADVTATAAGGAGEPTITAAEGADARLVPTPFAALTVHV